MRNIKNIPINNSDIYMQVEYDKNAKKILAWKPILARIFKRVISEFSDYSIKAVEKSIEGDIKISSIPLNPVAPLQIIGNSTDGYLYGEGTTFFDISTYVILPNAERIKIIVNIEAQKKDDPGYDLVSRAIFYCARLLSMQLDREFTNKSSDTKKYDNIKKVYSIWICMSAQQNQADSIVEYSIQPRTIYFGEHKDRIFAQKQHRYDLMSAIMVYLSNVDWESKDSLIDMLDTIFSSKKAEIKKEKLQNIYGIQVEKEIEGVVNDMCNLGEGLAERYMSQGFLKGRSEGILQGRSEGILQGRNEGILQGRSEGILQGRSEGKIEVFKSLVKDGILTIEDAVNRSGLSEEVFRKL